MVGNAGEVVSPRTLDLRDIADGRSMLRDLQTPQTEPAVNRKRNRSQRLKCAPAIAVYTTNIATPATNIIKVVAATTTNPILELGCPCMSFLSDATIRIATRRNDASSPLITAVQ